MPVNQKIFDELLDNALLTFRFAASERAATFERLKELEKELVVKLTEEAITGRQQRRVESFIKEAASLIDARYTALQIEFKWQEFSRIVAEDMRYGIAVALGTDAIYLPVESYFASLASDIMILGAPSADWWRGQSQDLQFKFAQQVRQGLNNSETNQQIILRIVGKSGEPGIMETARRNAASLVQTSVQTVANDARRNTFKANGDVIAGLKQISTLDSHTSLTCIAYSEAEWNLDFKPIGKKRLPYNNGVPRHFNCRSVEVPITKTFKQLGINAPEPDLTVTSFQNFLERKGITYQNEMLGKGRAELWRAGKITLKDLVDGRGRPLTLAELQMRIAAKRR